MTKEISRERVAEIIEKSKKALTVEDGGGLYLNDKAFEAVLGGIKEALGDSSDSPSLSMLVNLALTDLSEVSCLENSGKYTAEVRFALDVADKASPHKVTTIMGKALGRDIFELLIFGDKGNKNWFLASMDGVKVVFDKNYCVDQFNLFVGNRMGIEIIEDVKGEEMVYKCTIQLALEPDMEAVERKIKWDKESEKRVNAL